MRWPTPLTPIIIAKLLGGGGASVTPESVLYALQGMDSTQAGDALTAINGEANPTVVHDTSAASVTITAAANTIYEYGELTSLTVTTIPASGDFIIRFTSGSTATTTSFPASMKFSEAFAAEANTRYEINVSNGYALVASWPIS